MAQVSTDKPTNRPRRVDPVDYWLTKATQSSNGCLIVKACSDKDGYPLAWKNSRNGKLHRLSRLVLEKKLQRPLHELALHTCDNPACVNPAHLYEGTQKQNRLDSKIRNRTAKGKANGKPRKLTESSVIDIRSRAASGEPQHKIASDYRIHQVTVSKIIRKETWAWL